MLRFIMLVFLNLILAVTLTPTHAQQDCKNPTGVKMNAVFVHATVECNKNYMDTNIGNAMLGLARQEIQRCHFTETDINGFFMYEAGIFDERKRNQGLEYACKTVEDAYQDMQKMRK